MRYVSLILLALLAGPVAALPLEQPCRVLDTRFDADGVTPMLDGSTNGFSVRAEDSPGQGGAVGCGVPAEAASVDLIVHSYTTEYYGGYARVLTWGVEPSAAAWANVTFGPPLSVRSIPLTIALPAAGSLHDIAVRPLVAAHFIVDVVGWEVTPAPDVTVVAAGTVENLVSLPDSVEFDLAGGYHVKCAAPFISLASCAGLPSCVTVAGHTLELFGNVTLYAREVSPCP